MNILTVDLGRTCGWASSREGRIDCGAWVNPHTHGAWPASFFREFSDWIVNLKSWHKPDVFAMCETRPLSMASRQSLYGMRAAAMLALGNSVTYHTLNESHIKKVVLGSGKVWKATTQRWALEHFKLAETPAPDAADALLALTYVLKEKEAENG